MIMNASTVLATAIDLANDAYSVNLQLSWIPNQIPQTFLPTAIQPTTGGPGFVQLFNPVWIDNFDPSVVRNVSLPAIRAITGYVCFRAGNATSVPGSFFIMQANSGIIHAIHPQTWGQVEFSVVSFCLPIYTPKGSLITFAQETDSSGLTNGCANVTLLTFDPESYFIGGS